jgi:hypothetical protein
MMSIALWMHPIIQLDAISVVYVPGNYPQKVEEF